MCFRNCLCCIHLDMFTRPPFSLGIQVLLGENKWNKNEKTHELGSR